MVVHRSSPHGLAIALALWLLSSGSALAGDPSLRWRTVETPHFRIHYYRSARHDERELAQRLAVAAELAHEKLTKALRSLPTSRRVDIVLTDDTDGANGSAQNVPMDLVRLYAVGPTSLSSLDDYDDWLYLLILHEYTHIVHIDTIHGLAKLVNYVLGKTWPPNAIQPKWFIEGLAVYYESARSSGGRLRNTVFDMILRTAILEGKFLDLDQISSATRYYPHGNVPYLYGSRFVEYLADRFGEDKVTEVSHRYGGTVVPYAINRIAKEVLGHTYVDLYADFKRHLQKRYELQRASAAARGLTTFRSLTTHGETVSNPVLSADGRELAYIDGDGRNPTVVKIRDLRSGRIVQWYHYYGGNGLSFTPDRQYLVYGGSSTWQSYYSYDDLFVRHRASGRIRRLTYGMRVRDPAVSPDGRTIAFATTDLGDMNLALMPFQGGPTQVIYRGRDGEQIFTPRWSPDGKQLVYSQWSKGGYRDIYLRDMQSGHTRRLTADRALDTDPVFSPDGRRIYFSSDRTGIFNIYCFDLESSQLWQVSNVLGGAFQPAVSSDENEVYYVGFSAVGYDLHMMPLDRSRYLPALPLVETRPEPVLINVPKNRYSDRRYNPLTTLYPHNWMYSVGTDAFGTSLGIQLNGADVAGLHHWSLNTNVGTARGDVSYLLTYGYDGLWPSISLDTSRYIGLRSGMVIDGVRKNYVEENYGAGLGLGVPLLRYNNHSVNMSFGYRFNFYRNADRPPVVVMPDQLTPVFPQEGILAGMTAGLSYSHIRRFAWSISNEEGRFLAVNFRFNHPSLGSDWQTVTASWNWTEYLRMPWVTGHVLALRYTGGIGTGDTSRRGLFFLGGFPEQDVLRSFFDPDSRVGGAFLRGYPPGTVYGDQYHLLNIEYRAPIANIERGLSSLPLYFTHIWGSAFTDLGNAFFHDPVWGDVKVGVGAELMLEMVIGYFVGTTFRFGYARGFMDKGGNQYHFLLGGTF